MISDPKIYAIAERLLDLGLGEEPLDYLRILLDSAAYPDLQSLIADVVTLARYHVEHTQSTMTTRQLRDFVPEEGFVVIVLGPHSWGKAATGLQAYRNAGSPREWSAFQVLPKTWVSSADGSLHLDGEDNPQGLPRHVLFQKIGQRRVLRPTRKKTSV